MSRGTRVWCPSSAIAFVYGPVTPCGAASQRLRLTMTFVTVATRCSAWSIPFPTTPHIKRLQAITYVRFGLFPVRSPLLGESFLLSVPAGTEMFHFPAFAPLCLCIQHRVTRYLTSTGFPIRTSPDQSLFSSSPKLFAAIHVLRRRLVPRHPPCALCSLIRLFPIFCL